jgi:hypothetical protein
VGYHYIIRRDGVLETGRPEEVAGAHARGFNHNSISISLVGGVSEDDVKMVKRYALVLWKFARTTGATRG